MTRHRGDLFENGQIENVEFSAGPACHLPPFITAMCQQWTHMVQSEGSGEAIGENKVHSLRRGRLTIISLPRTLLVNIADLNDKLRTFV